MAAYTLTEARYDRVLAWINKLRAEHKIGRPLKRIPRGYQGAYRGCPLSVALGGAGVVSEAVDIGPPGARRLSVPTPNYVRAFVEAFDEGKCTRLRKLALPEA